MFQLHEEKLLQLKQVESDCLIYPAYNPFSKKMLRFHGPEFERRQEVKFDPKKVFTFNNCSTA